MLLVVNEILLEFSQKELKNPGVIKSTKRQKKKMIELINKKIDVRTQFYV